MNEVKKEENKRNMEYCVNKCFYTDICSLLDYDKCHISKKKENGVKNQPDLLKLKNLMKGFDLRKEQSSSFGTRVNKFLNKETVDVSEPKEPPEAGFTLRTDNKHCPQCGGISGTQGQQGGYYKDPETNVYYCSKICAEVYKKRKYKFRKRINNKKTI